ncbi:NUDIX domain-containing protein [Natronosporangium hydrolyticum]|uniref:NUDIX domain-containing protein n=1 Tax=Natronosporangium hydrolyticum TaxID=2811111 RepID=A0A895YKK6_9ACTN|nr:NUDIX domain-containing protein [Natronosporangium hydrolyticum]QSB15176.1 NUDIX domain-containing protein [Natronosporangium hydrolyticum]
MSSAPRHSVSVAAAVINNDGHALVIRRRDTDAWQLPGGILELGETLHEGVRREVLEETGVVVEPTRLTGVYKNMRLGVVALVFHAHPIAGSPQPTDEAAAVEWWPIERITATMNEAFAIRLSDAFRDEQAPAVRAHDGTHLLDPDPRPADEHGRT